MRWTRLLSSPMLFLLVADQAWGTATLTRYPYPQSLGSDRVTIMWRTATSALQTLECGVYGQSFAMHQADVAATTHHEIMLTGLQPGTRSAYRITEAGSVVLSDPDKYWFKTDPGPANPYFSFFVTGDVGVQLFEGEQAVTGQMIDNVVPIADFGLLTGDIIYPDGEFSRYDAQLMSLWQHFMCHTPIWPCLGNHDWQVDPDQNFAREWALPNNEHWYSFDYGNMHLIALDSADGFLYDEANHLAWLEQDLQKRFRPRPVDRRLLPSPGADVHLQRQHRTSAPYVFLLGLTIGLAALLQEVLTSTRPPFCESCEPVATATHFPVILEASLRNLARIELAGVAWAGGFCLAIFRLLGWRVDINLFSLQGFYSNRLVRCFLGATRISSTMPHIIKRQPHRFTGFDPADDLPLSALRDQCPFHIVNAAMNLSGGEDLAWQTRRAAAFTYTPCHTGYEYCEVERCAHQRLSHRLKATRPTSSPISTRRQSFR